MRKLRLDPDTLRVESFASHDDRGPAQGTVVARSITFTGEPYRYSCGSDDPSANCEETDYDWYTCGESCVNMCLPTNTCLPSGDDPRCTGD